MSHICYIIEKQVLSEQFSNNFPSGIQNRENTFINKPAIFKKIFISISDDEDDSKPI